MLTNQAWLNVNHMGFIQKPFAPGPPVPFWSLVTSDDANDGNQI